MDLISFIDVIQYLLLHLIRNHSIENAVIVIAIKLCEYLSVIIMPGSMNSFRHFGFQLSQKNHFFTYISTLLQQAFNSCQHLLTLKYLHKN